MLKHTKPPHQGHPPLLAGVALGIVLAVSWLSLTANAQTTTFRHDAPAFAAGAIPNDYANSPVQAFDWPAMPAAPAAPQPAQPQALADECQQLLGNPSFTVSGSSFSPWQVLNPNVYSSSQNFVSPPTSAVMPDNDDGDPTPTEDALGQLFTMPTELSSVTIEYQSGTGNTNATDKAYGNLWTVDDEDELDTFIGGWQIPDSANSWTARTVIIDDAADLAPMAGQRMAIVLFTETDAQAPDENVFLDDVRLTACSNAAAEPTATPTRPPVVGRNHFLPAIFNPAAPAQPTPTPTATTPPEPPGDWRLETVASEGNQGGWTSIDVDNGGNPHVSFNDITRRRIVYAHRTGTGWQTQDIDQFAVWVTDLTAPSAVAVGPTNYPQITYKINTPGVFMRHVEWDGATWNVVQFSGIQPTWMAMALKQDGEPCISFYLADPWPSVNTYKFKLLCRTGGTWPATATTVSPTLFGTAEMEKSIHALAIGSGNRSHLSYTSGGLYYIRETDTRTWVNSLVDNGGGGRVGYYSSLALDNQDRAHISYYDLTNGDLKYARWDGSQWRVETVDSGGDVGKYTSIGLDSSGRAHISYYDVSNKNLKYAYWTGSHWRIETVDSTGQVGEFTALALDNGGAAYISYYDRSNGDLKVATNAAAAARWHQATTDQQQLLPAIFKPAAPAQPTPTPTPTPTASPEPPDDWIVIASEDFEGEFPQPGWSLGGTNYTWAKRDCRPGNGSFSGWVIGGGPLGGNLLCGAEYPGYLMGASAPPRLTYGPFSLVGASDAQLQFRVWTNIASASGHSLAYCATRNGFNFYCRSLNGSTNGWETRTFSLKNISGLGSLLGEPRVWIRFIFSSYQAPYLPEGAYLDDIVLQKKE